jgi:hypothetical protein
MCSLTEVTGSGNESWLEEFPAELVLLLAHLDDARLEAVGAEFGNTEEFDAPAAAAEEFIGELRDLSRHAISLTRGLYLWNSL